MENKKAIILLNLGGPENLSCVKSFLFNLFYDKAIIDLPNPIRFLLAKFISSRRERKAQEIYKSIGNKSPILKNTKNQAEKLEQNLNKKGNYKVYVAMRYTFPRAKDIIKDIEMSGINDVLLLPMYPQFSITTSKSSIDEFQKIAKNLRVKYICCYPNNQKFIDAHVNKIKKSIELAQSEEIRVIFTAHGLPLKTIKKGDPYQWQVEETVREVVKKLNIKQLDYVISYQSKVGPLKWLGPNTEDEIIKASKDEKIIILVPISFVSEHSETLYELDIQYAKIASDHLCKQYIRVPSLGEDSFFIEALCDLVENYDQERICPKEFCQCINEKING